MSTTDAAVLTAEDITALRLADGVSFSVRNGRARIRAYLSTERWGGEPRILSAREQRAFPDTDGLLDQRERVIECAYRVQDHGPSSEPTHVGHTCHYYNMFARQEDTAWRTIARALHAGDQISLEWTAANDCENNRAVGYHRDELVLVAGDAERKRMTRWYLVAVQVGPDNSARMVRRVYGNAPAHD